MKNIPFILKLAINFAVYIIYTFIVSILFSFVFPLLLKLFWKTLYASNDPIFTKIQFLIALIVLIISVIYRKYFYLSLSWDDSVIENFKKHKEQKKNKKIDLDNLNNYYWDDDDIKIYVDKEIKR